MMVLILLKMRSRLSIICVEHTEPWHWWLSPRRFNATTNSRDQLLNANSWGFPAKFNVRQGHCWLFLVLEPKPTFLNSNETQSSADVVQFRQIHPAKSRIDRWANWSQAHLYLLSHQYRIRPAHSHHLQLELPGDLCSDFGDALSYHNCCIRFFAACVGCVGWIVLSWNDDVVATVATLRHWDEWKSEKFLLCFVKSASCMV